MEIITAKTAGFCFGVKRAVDTVYEQIEKKGDSPIYTYGPIIHNQEVIRDLKSRGVRVLETEEELRNIKNGTVIIRSHGVPKRIYDIMNERSIDYVDATCPFVLKIHRIVEKESKAGKHIIIIGNDKHPEVIGIKGWADSEVTVIQSTEEARSFSLPDCETSACIVSQTTFNYKKFQELVEIILEKSYNIIVLNTICSTTEERQKEAREIAAQVDGMLVIGDSHSSNTQKLFEICNKECENTYYIQTLDNLDSNQLISMESVGITAGASTPNNIIEEVQNYVRVNF
jgi:4-hydroxy-3-methylbut-2-enyl diphosphate reductase